MKYITKRRVLYIFALLLLSLAVAFSLTIIASADESERTDTERGYKEHANNTNAIAELTKSYRPKTSITLNSDFIINIYIPAKHTQSFTLDGDFYGDLENFDCIAEINGESYYKVTVELPAAEAAREIALSVNAEFDGASLIGSFVFSIPKYATAVISSDASETEKTLMKDALSYISSAYSYFEKEDSAAVNEKISEIIGDYNGRRAIRSIDSPENPGIKSAAFVLESTPGIKFYIESGIDTNAYTFYVNNRRIDEVTKGIDDGGRYLFVSLQAYKMCGPISYAVDGKISGYYGINNYYSYVSKSSYTDEDKEELRSLLRKFYNYSMSAADYYIDYHSASEATDCIDIGEYVIVYPESSGASLIDKAEKLAFEAMKKFGISLPVVSDKNLNSKAKRIFVGNSLLIPTDINVKLSQEDSEDAFILDFSKGDVALFGKTSKSTERAIEYFIENYVHTSDEKIISLNGESTVIKPFIALENGSEIVVEDVSTVFGVVPGIYKGGLYPSKLSKSYYPSVIELKHNGENNGKLIAILAVNDTPTAEYKHLDTNACVMESSDGGRSWKMIARPQETINPTYTAEDGTEYAIQGISMAHIYELPTQVGDMPAGTLLYSGTSVNYDCYSQVAIWRSFDCGYTWEEFTVIASGGGLREGVWEPFTMYEESDGYLYCFYSDDSDPLHDQKLVFKRSKDGINWSDEIGVCVFKKQKDRPGMIIMTKMGSGEYLCVYEYYGSHGGKIFYKITDDITDLAPTDPGTLLQSPDGYTIKGGPSCIWTEAGGECGTLIVSGKEDIDGGQRHLLFASFDYGRSWTTIENPLAYDITLDVKATNRIGHSASFITSSDPSVIYYLNTTVNPETGYQRVECAKLKIYE